MERKSTGGTKTFQYTKEDLEHIRKTDTGSTKRFKEAYAKWQEQKLQDKILDEELRKRQRNMLLLVLMLLAFVFILLALRFF